MALVPSPPIEPEPPPARRAPAGDRAHEPARIEPNESIQPGHRRLYLDECGLLRACIIARSQPPGGDTSTVWIRAEAHPEALREADPSSLFAYDRRLLGRLPFRPRPTGEDFIRPPLPVRTTTEYPPLTGLAPTPFRTAAFKAGLADHPNRDFASFIVSGIEEGIDTFTTVQGSGKIVRNLRSGFQFPEKVTEFLQAEEAAGRFFRIPAKGLVPDPGVRPDLHFSPLGTAPKRSYQPGVVKRRVISHHSAGPVRGVKTGSVNGEIEMAGLAVEFQNVLDVMDCVRDFGPDARLSKTDIRSAYRNLPIRPCLQHTQCSEWNGILRADLCLSFGTASGPWTFEQYACGIHYILQKDLDRVLGLKKVVVFHYLDDCILVGCNEDSSRAGFEVMRETYNRLGIPISEEKTEAAMPQSEFLGLLIDAKNQDLLYPDDKREDLIGTLQRILKAGKSNLRTLRSTLGKLGFAHAVFPLARPFVTELFRLTHRLKRDDHHIRLSALALADVEVWIRTLTDNKGAPLKNRDQAANRREAISAGHWACGDASGETGYGWFTDKTFTTVLWEAHERASFSGREFSNSSTWQETVAAAAASLSWLEEGNRGKLFVYFSDAENLRHNDITGRSNNAAVNGLLRMLSEQLMTNDCRMEVVWQPRTHQMQRAADLLSRDDTKAFREALGDRRGLRRTGLRASSLRKLREASRHSGPLTSSF